MKKSKFYILRPSIALEIGETEAIILEKIAVYSRGKAHNLKGETGKWIYNSVTMWKEQHFPHWSISKIYRALKSLEAQGLIVSKQASFGIKQNILWFKVLEKGYKLLNDSIAEDKNSEYSVDIYNFITKDELGQDVNFINCKEDVLGKNNHHQKELYLRLNEMDVKRHDKFSIATR